MANNVANVLTIKCQNPVIMERIKKLIYRIDKNNKQEFTMEILLPRSMAFADFENYDLFWNKAVWGTERDVREYSIMGGGDTLILVYKTVWNPNRGWVKTLCCYIHYYLLYSQDKNTCHLEVEHRYSDYLGNFGGILTWKPGTDIKYNHYDSYMEYLRNTDSDAYQYMLEVEKGMESNANSISLISTPI
jgi:hypothetical protein